jgi:arsenate reductase (glutaredoxin)
VGRLPDDATKATVTDAASAIALMQARPTLIKRPVLEAGPDVVVGFSEAVYAARLKK